MLVSAKCVKLIMILLTETQESMSILECLFSKIASLSSVTDRIPFTITCKEKNEEGIKCAVFAITTIVITVNIVGILTVNAFPGYARSVRREPYSLRLFSASWHLENAY